MSVLKCKESYFKPIAMWTFGLKGFLFFMTPVGFRNIFMGRSFYESTVSIFKYFVKEDPANTIWKITDLKAFADL